MIYCTYSEATNALLGISEAQPALEPGQLVVVLGRGLPDLAAEEWSPPILNFIRKPGVVLTKLAYLRRFTAAERIAIRAAAKQSAALEDYLGMLEVAEEIRLFDTDTVAAVGMLEQAGLIAPGRAAEILA